jgi:Fic family protein
MRDPHIQITPQMLSLIAHIDEFKGRWHALQTLSPDRLSSLRHVATIESIGSSTRIEGVKLTDTQIEQLLKGLDASSFENRDEQEVAGYAEAMDLIFESFADIPLNENHIKQLHKVLLKYGSKDDFHRGEYKKLANHVEAFDATGKSIGVIFETTTPFDTPNAMGELLAWTNGTLKRNDLHPLLIIAVFVVHFLAIHPFQDGNGRLSRILTTLLLLQNGYGYVPYSSLERVIEDNKDGYYLALRKAQATLKTDDSQLNDWLTFFFECLRKQTNVLKRKIEHAQTLTQLNELSESILRIAREQGRVTVSDALAITNANRNTLKVRFRELVADGYLQQYGQGKGTFYTIKS